MTIFEVRDKMVALGTWEGSHSPPLGMSEQEYFYVQADGLLIEALEDMRSRLGEGGLPFPRSERAITELIAAYKKMEKRYARGSVVELS